MCQHHGGHRGLETMPKGDAAGFQTQRMHIDHVGSVQGDKSMGRTHETDAAPPWQIAVRLQLVGHHFRYGKLGDGLVQGYLQAIGKGGTLQSAVQKQRLCLAIQRAAQVRDCDVRRAKCLQFLQKGRGGLARCIERHAHRHQFVRLGFVGRAWRNVTHMDRQAPGRCIHRTGASPRNQPQVGQLSGQYPAKGLPQVFQGLRGQFFHQHLDK